MSVYEIVNSHLGVYPTLDDGSPNPCIDSNRPFWLPYWFDTASEESCKHNNGFGPFGIDVGISLPSFAVGGQVLPDGTVGNFPSEPSAIEKQLKQIALAALVIGGALFLTKRVL